MKNSKGFTLVEILAAVVILGIIALIASNVVLKQLDKSRKQAFLTDIQQFIKSTNYDALVKDRMEDYIVYEFPNSGIEILSKNADAGYMIKDENDKVSLQIWNRNLGLCASKSFSEKEVKYDQSLTTEEDCDALLPNVVSDKNISIKSLTGEDSDAIVNASCYTLDSNNMITDYDTTNCGTVFVVPNKINGVNVAGISDSFVTDGPKDLTALYLIGVKNITETPVGFAGNNPDLEKVVISMLPNLEVIKANLGNGSNSLTTFQVSHCPKLVAMHSSIHPLVNTGIFNEEGSNLENLTLEDLPKLTKINNSFLHTKLKKINISNLDSLELITESSFAYNDGDSDLIISNNKNLTQITNVSFFKSNLKSVKIFNNEKLRYIGANSFTGANDKSNYIDELYIYDNPNLEEITNAAFSNLTLDTVEIKNNPKLNNIKNGAFANTIANEFDLSGSTFETFYFSAFGGASIKVMKLPSTVTTISQGSASSFNSIITDKLQFSCSLINLFRTDNGNGTYTYLVDQSKLPVCQ